jgi:hypothetical protein
MEPCRVWTALRLTGTLDVAALRQALDLLCARATGHAASLTTLDLSREQRSTTDVEAVVRTVLAEEALSLQELGPEPLFRGWLVRIEPDQSVLSLVLDTDAPVPAELPGAYAAVRAGRPLPEPRPAGTETWSARMAGAPPLNLTRGRAGAAGMPVLCRYGFALPAAESDRILAGFVAVLGRRSGQDDVVVGVRFGHARLPMRVDLSGGVDLAGLLARVRTERAAAARYAAAGREGLLRALFDDGCGVWRSHDLHGEVLITPGAGEPELTLRVRGTGERRHAEFAYRADLFDGATIRQMARQLGDLMAGAERGCGHDRSHMAAEAR